FRDGLVVRREGDRNSTTMERGERVRRDRRNDAGLPVRRRTEIERDAARGQLGTQVRIFDGPGSVRDALRGDREGATDLRRTAPFAGVDRDPETRLPGDRERRGLDQRVGERLLGSRE